MKKLQNNFTTPEQSKRLLELGVPADSADCYHVARNNYTAILHNELFTKCRDNIIRVSKTAYRAEMHDDDILPCWSVGRLIEIALICATTAVKPYINFSTSEGWSAANNIDYMMSIFVNYSSTYMDFSKLEEGWL